MLLRSKFVLDVSQKEKISPSSLLLADPYMVLRPALVQQLFDSNKANELVPSNLLKEVRHYVTYIPVPENATFQFLQKQLNNLSIFAGRNPMVSICIYVTGSVYEFQWRNQEGIRGFR